MAPFATRKSWVLTAGSGTRKVSVFFQDAWNNRSTVAATDSITLDVTAPVNGRLVATPGSGSVTLSWSGFTDALTGIVSYALVMGTTSLATACTNGTTLYTGTDTSFVQPVPADNRLRYFRVCAVDGAGNTSSGASANARALP